GALQGTSLATFDTANEGFAYNIYNGTPGNLATPPDGGTAATLAWTGTDGSPAAGSLRADAPFSDYNQYIDIQKGFATPSLQDWTGKKIHVRVKVPSGLNPDATNPTGAQPYVTSYVPPVDGGAGAQYNFCGKYSNVVAGNGWNDYVLDLSTPCAAPFDAS